MLNSAVNELAKEAPAEPYSFLINSLLKAAAAKGVETAFELRMKSIQATLQQEQANAQGEVVALKKRVAELEGGAPAGAGAGAAPVAGGATAVPLGHTTFSWNGGLAEGADVSAATSHSASSGSAAPPRARAPAPAPAAKKAAAPAPAKKAPEPKAAKAPPRLSDRLRNGGGRRRISRRPSLLRRGATGGGRAPGSAWGVAEPPGSHADA